MTPTAELTEVLFLISNELNRGPLELFTPYTQSQRPNPWNLRCGLFLTLRRKKLTLNSAPHGQRSEEHPTKSSVVLDYA